MIYMVIGTRPDIVKMAPIIQELKDRGVAHKVIHTGQHYSKNLDQDLRNEFDIQVDFRLQVTIGRGVESSINTIYEQFCKYLQSQRALPSYLVAVYGDTLSALACAMAAKTMGCNVAHIEAGLRSHDLTMPEEVARINIDTLSDRMYAPTYAAYENLRTEHFPPHKILVAGNTIVNSLHASMSKVCTSIDIDDLLVSHNITGTYAVMTLHRPENTNSDMILSLCILAAEAIARKKELQDVILLCHPRTMGRLKTLISDSIICLMEPVPHHIMLGLMNKSEFVMTDSGGMQEECALLDKKCITFRKSTERPETIDSGHNLLISPYTHDISKGDYLSEVLAHLENSSMREVSYGINPATIIATDLENWRKSQ